MRILFDRGVDQRHGVLQHKGSEAQTWQRRDMSMKQYLMLGWMMMIPLEKRGVLGWRVTSLRKGLTVAFCDERYILDGIFNSVRIWTIGDGWSIGSAVCFFFFFFGCILLEYPSVGVVCVVRYETRSGSWALFGLIGCCISDLVHTPGNVGWLA